MIRLAPIGPEHSAQLVRWSEDLELKEYFRRYPPSMQWINNVPAAFASAYAIYDEDELVGVACLANVDLQSRKAEIGVMIDSEKRAKRAKPCVAAMKLVAEYAFDYLGLNKLYALVLPHRDDLARLLSMYGFKEEGLLRDNLFWEGRYHDEVIMGLTRSHYKGKK